MRFQEHLLLCKLNLVTPSLTSHSHRYFFRFCKYILEWSMKWSTVWQFPLSFGDGLLVKMSLSPVDFPGMLEEERSGWPSLSLQAVGNHVASWDSFTSRLEDTHRERKITKHESGLKGAFKIYYTGSHQVLLWLNNQKWNTQTHARTHIKSQSSSPDRDRLVHFFLFSAESASAWCCTELADKSEWCINTEWSDNATKQKGNKWEHPQSPSPFRKYSANAEQRQRRSNGATDKPKYLFPNYRELGCLLIRAGSNATLHDGATVGQSSLLVGCWCCCCTLTKQVMKAN